MHQTACLLASRLLTPSPFFSFTHFLAHRLSLAVQYTLITTTTTTTTNGKWPANNTEHTVMQPIIFFIGTEINSQVNNK